MTISPNGLDVLRQAVKTLPTDPGVYRMLDAQGQPLYVGKAKHLKHRVTNYTQLDGLTPRLKRMVMQVASLEITVTRSEAEALLLEANLIKSLRPRFNILLRDDKSFPYIQITGAHAFPRITKFRGKKRAEDTYFGPYASAGDVNRALTLLQKAFLLRPCSDAFFAARSRPCMEYQIKRCSAPCVNKISAEEYAQQVKQAIAFLQGKTSEIQQQLTTQMEAASTAMQFERAAVLRDRIRTLNAVQAKQGVAGLENIGDADVVAVHKEHGQACIHIFFVRGGQMLGDKSYFPQHAEENTVEEILEAFLGRFYQINPPPPLVLLSHDLYAREVLQQALLEYMQQRVELSVPQRGEKRALVERALANAIEALQRHVQQSSSVKALHEQLQQLFALPTVPDRIEVFDNSHIFGKHAVGGMIVATGEGFLKSAYRKYTVDAGEKSTGGDDFWMLEQVLRRRYGRLNQTEHKDAIRPDIILIDGGAGQLSVAERVFTELGVDIPYICIAKGPDRNAGREEFHRPHQPPFTLPPQDPALYYLQRLRDEAHRFAISSHRQKRAKSLTQSTLDAIPSIGAARKRALLKHFGSARDVSGASVEELARVEGISETLAQQIYDALHS